jgi:hypothetical protein
VAAYSRVIKKFKKAVESGFLALPFTDKVLAFPKA